MLSYIIIASLLEMLVAFAGVFFIFLDFNRFKRYLPYFISFSVGTFLGVVFFGVLPEAINLSTPKEALFFALVGFLTFFLLSRVLFWYHHHDGEEHDPLKSSASLVLAGDFIHNAIDGVIIALAFTADYHIGVITTLAVLAHEFPQEVSNFFVLVNAGMKKGKALLYNFLVSISTVVMRSFTTLWCTSALRRDFFNSMVAFLSAFSSS